MLVTSAYQATMTEIFQPRLMLTPTPTRPLEIVHLYRLQANRQKFITIIDSFKIKF